MPDRKSRDGPESQFGGKVSAMGISRCRLAGECLRPTRSGTESVSARGLSASRSGAGRSGSLRRHRPCQRGGGAGADARQQRRAAPCLERADGPRASAGCRAPCRNPSALPDPLPAWLPGRIRVCRRALLRHLFAGRLPLLPSPKGLISKSTKGGSFLNPYDSRRISSGKEPLVLIHCMRLAAPARMPRRECVDEEGDVPARIGPLFGHGLTWCLWMGYRTCH